MLTAADFDEPPRALGKIQLPTDYAPNRHDFQKEVVHRLETGHAGAALEAGPSPRRGVDERLAPGRGRSRARRSPEGRRAGRASRPRGRGAAHACAQPQPVGGPRLRPRAAGPGELGLRRRLGADRRRQDPGQDVPRVRPADRRVPASGPARRPRAGSAGRPGVGVRLRAPQPGAAADGVVPVADRAQALAAHRRDQLRARGDRGGSRPVGAPAARPDVRRRRLSRGRRGRASPRWSRPRSCPAATSCAR